MNKKDIDSLKKEAQKELKKAKTLKDLDVIYKKYLAKKKGKLTKILRSLKDLPRAKRKELGNEANQLKEFLIKEIQEKEKSVEQKTGVQEIDITAPGREVKTGHIHPLTKIIRMTEEIFEKLGFSVVEGPEVETEYYNFDALNIPEQHPARDLWDTFFIKQPSSELGKTARDKTKNKKLKTKSSKLLLRTHTSPVQIRYMENNNPPLRIVVPGRCFRHERTDASHDIQFYQVEGLMVGKAPSTPEKTSRPPQTAVGKAPSEPKRTSRPPQTANNEINAANFKAIIQEFFNRFFEKHVEIRLRPSYFPFTEPSFEVDLKSSKEKQAPSARKRAKEPKNSRPPQTARIKQTSEKSVNASRPPQTAWVEIMGAGMVHPKVFEAVGYNPENWQGFAFGVGLDRLAMMKYNIDDIRLLYKNDLRFLEQF